MTDGELELESCSDSLAEFLTDIADEYAARLARGESPDTEEYAARRPDSADTVRSVLESLQLISPSSKPPGLAFPQLGDFRIVRELGSGGMATVYEAEQISLHRRVALKVLPSTALRDPRQLQRFRNEALAAAGLDHPHIVKVYGVGTDQGEHFIAMQLIEGRSLADAIRERLEGPTAISDDFKPTGEIGPDRRTPLTLEYLRQVAVWGSQAAEALEHAHSCGVVHRDVKPSNLLIDGNGTLFVADFGLAKHDTDARPTQHGDLIGTPLYMSPEQAAAQHDLVDHRSDVYSLGATLYELLTLTPPFAGDRLAVLHQIANDDPLPPRNREMRIPVDLQTIVLKAMAKDPARRYQTAREMNEDLRQFLADRPIKGRPPSRFERLGRWAKRNRSIAAGLIVAMAIAIPALAICLVVVDEYRRESETEAEKLLRRTEELRREDYVTRIGLAKQEFDRDNPERLREILDGLSPRESEEDIRGYEWRYLDTLLHIERKSTVFGHDDPILSADITSDGKHVATADKTGLVKVWNTATGQSIERRYSNQEVTCVRFSPDGQSLAACGQDQKIWVFEIENLKEVVKFDGHDGTVTSIAWSPDGKRLVSGGRDGLVQILNIETSLAKQITHHGEGVVVTCVAWSTSPNWKRVASGGEDSHIRICNPDTFEHLSNLRVEPNEKQLALAFSRDGDFLATGGYAENVCLFNVRTKQRIRTFKSRYAVWSLNFDEAGRYLWIAHSDGIEVWDYQNPTQATPVKAIERRGRQRALAFTRDGNRILTATEQDQTVRLESFEPLLGYQQVNYAGRCIAAGGTAGRVLIRNAKQVGSLRAFPRGTGENVIDPDFVSDPTSAAFSRDGKLLVTGQSTGLLRFWDPSIGQSHFKIRDVRGPATIAISDDGSRAAVTAKGLVCVWGTGDRKGLMRRQVADVEVRPVLSPDGSMLALTFRGTVAVVRVDTDETVFYKEFVQGATSMAFSPDGARLAIGESKHGAKLWDIRSGQQIAEFRGPGGAVRSLDFSPDGRTLATVHDDRTVRLWNLATGRELFVLYRHDTPLESVRFESSNRLILVANSKNGFCEVFAFPPIDR